MDTTKRNSVNEQWGMPQRPSGVLLSKGRCKPGRDFSTKACAMHRCNSLFFLLRAIFPRESLAFCHFYHLSCFLSVKLSKLILCSFLLYCGTYTTFLPEALRGQGYTRGMKVTFVNYYTLRILGEKENLKNTHAQQEESRDKIPFFNIFLSRYILTLKRLFYGEKLHSNY